MQTKGKEAFKWGLRKTNYYENRMTRLTHQRKLQNREGIKYNGQVESHKDIQTRLPDSWWWATMEPRSVRQHSTWRTGLIATCTYLCNRTCFCCPWLRPRWWPPRLSPGPRPRTPPRGHGRATPPWTTTKFRSVLRIRIRIRIRRIRMLLGLLDPDLDPLVRGMDPAQNPSITKQK